MATLSLTWRIRDDKACAYCKALDGHTWTFEVGKDTMIGALEFEGKIAWTPTGEAGAHSHCRCDLELDVDLSDLVVAANELLQTIESAQAAEAQYPEGEYTT